MLDYKIDIWNRTAKIKDVLTGKCTEEEVDRVLDDVLSKYKKEHGDNIGYVASTKNVDEDWD